MGDLFYVLFNIFMVVITAGGWLVVLFVLWFIKKFFS